MIIRKLPTSSYFELLLLSVLRYEPLTKQEAISTVQRNIERWGLGVNMPSLYKAFDRLEQKVMIQSRYGQLFTITDYGLRANYWLQNIAKDVAEASRLVWLERSKIRDDFEAQADIEQVKQEIEESLEGLRQKVKLAKSLPEEEQLEIYRAAFQEVYGRYSDKFKNSTSATPD